MVRNDAESTLITIDRCATYWQSGLSSCRVSMSPPTWASVVPTDARCAVSTAFGKALASGRPAVIDGGITQWVVPVTTAHHPRTPS